MINLKVNGKAYQVDVDPSTPILWVIRDHIGLTGTKFGCGAAQCGACMIHLDGDGIRSCISPVSRAEGKEIVTIEGLDPNWANRYSRPGYRKTCRNADIASRARSWQQQF